MENHEELFKEVFGESSDSENDPQQDPIPSWEQIEEINGLWLCRDFLSSQHQSSLISAVLNEGWFTEDSHNQAMRFGDLPAWATELANSIREVVLLGDHVSKSTDLATSNGGTEPCLLPSNLLWREPLFDQLIVNVYRPGEGICAHVDLMRFEDGIAIVSLESSCVMHFARVEGGSDIVEHDERPPLGRKIPVLLTPGSLVLMSGEARYLWKHEINRKRGIQMWEGQELVQERRISITLRKLYQACVEKEKYPYKVKIRRKKRSVCCWLCHAVCICGICYVCCNERCLSYCGFNKLVAPNGCWSYNVDP